MTSQGVDAHSSVASSRTLAPGGSVVTLNVSDRASTAALLAAAADVALFALDAGDPAPGASALAPPAPAARSAGADAIDGACVAALFVVMRNTPSPRRPPSSAAPRTPTTIHAFDRRGLVSA